MIYYTRLGSPDIGWRVVDQRSSPCRVVICCLAQWNVFGFPPPTPQFLSPFDPTLLALLVSTGSLYRPAFLYSGLSRRKSALSLVWAVAASNAVVIFQWWFWGYSLAFSPTATNGYIGDLRSFALRKVLGDPSPGSPLIPELLYSFYQMEFACVTVAILMGALAERGRVLPAMVFTFIWMTLV